MIGLVHLAVSFFDFGLEWAILTVLPALARRETRYARKKPKYLHSSPKSMTFGVEKLNL